MCAVASISTSPEMTTSLIEAPVKSLCIPSIDLMADDVDWLVPVRLRVNLSIHAPAFFSCRFKETI